MNPFEQLQSMRHQLDQVEDGLRVLRDQVDLPTKPPINKAIGMAQLLRDGLYCVDNALEEESR